MRILQGVAPLENTHQDSVRESRMLRTPGIHEILLDLHEYAVLYQDQALDSKTKEQKEK